MNRCRALGHLAVVVAGLAGAVVAFAAATPAALASASPRRARVLSWADPPLPPGWTKHPPLPDPARAHAALAGDIPGWQLTLMAVTVVLLAATSVAIGYLGPAAPRPVGARIASALTASGAAPIRRGSRKSNDRTRPAGRAATASPDGSSRTSQPPRALRPASTGPLLRRRCPGSAR